MKIKVILNAILTDEINNHKVLTLIALNTVIFMKAI